MQRKLPRTSRFVAASVLISSLFTSTFGISSASAVITLYIKFDPSSLNLPAATPGRPYSWLLKANRGVPPVGSTGKPNYECVPQKLHIGSIQLTKDCRISGIATNDSSQPITKMVNFEIKDLINKHTFSSGNVKFTVQGSITVPTLPEPIPTTSALLNPNPTKTNLNLPMPQPNPQPFHSGMSYWQIGTWKSAAPVPMTIKVGPFAVGPVSCTMSGVVSVTLVLKIVDYSIPGDVKGVAPATSSDFKVVKINNDCGQAALAGNVFRTATDHLVGNVDFTLTDSQHLMSLNANGISSELGKFDLQGNSLTGSFNIPALTDANGTNISITSENFTYTFIS